MDLGGFARRAARVISFVSLEAWLDMGSWVATWDRLDPLEREVGWDPPDTSRSRRVELEPTMRFPLHPPVTGLSAAGVSARRACRPGVEWGVGEARGRSGLGCSLGLLAAGLGEVW